MNCYKFIIIFFFAIDHSKLDIFNTETVKNDSLVLKEDYLIGMF